MALNDRGLMQPRVRTTRPRGFQLGGPVRPRQQPFVRTGLSTAAEDRAQPSPTGNLVARRPADWIGQGGFDWGEDQGYSRERGTFQHQGATVVGYGNRGGGRFSEGATPPVRTGILRGQGGLRWPTEETERQQRQHGESMGWSVRGRPPGAYSLSRPERAPSEIMAARGSQAAGAEKIFPREVFYAGGGVRDRDQPGYAVGGLVDRVPELEARRGSGTLIRPPDPAPAPIPVPGLQQAQAPAVQRTDTVPAMLTPGEYVLPKWLVGDIQAGRPPGSGPRQAPSPISGVTTGPGQPVSPTDPALASLARPAQPLAQDDPLRTPVQFGLSDALIAAAVGFPLPAGLVNAITGTEEPPGFGSGSEHWRFPHEDDPTEIAKQWNKEHPEGYTDQEWEKIASEYGFEGQDLKEWANTNGLFILQDGRILDPSKPYAQQLSGHVNTSAGLANFVYNQREERRISEDEAKEAADKEAYQRELDAAWADRIDTGKKGVEAARQSGAEIIRRSAQLAAKNKARAAGRAVRSAFMSMATRPGEAGLAQAADARQVGVLAGANMQLIGELEAEKHILMAELKLVDIELQNINERVRFIRDDETRRQVSAEKEQIIQRQNAYNSHMLEIDALLKEANKPGWWEKWGPQLFGLVGEGIAAYFSKGNPQARDKGRQAGEATFGAGYDVLGSDEQSSAPSAYRLSSSGRTAT